MGKGGGAKIRNPVVAEVPATPAVARDAETLDDRGQGAQSRRRASLRGVRSTYARFADQQGGNGSKAKLG